MILQDVGMLAVSSNRTKLYLHCLASRQLLPAHVLYLHDPAAETPEAQALARRAPIRGRSSPGCHEFDLGLAVPELLERHRIPYERIAWLDPNADPVIEAVARCRPSLLIYSGPAGAILRRAILATGKRFLHVHPGALPAYRGSTTLYYSLLQDGTCAATALLLAPQLDAGDIVRVQRYPPPVDRTAIDLDYDPWIRAQLLAEVLEEYARTGSIRATPQPPGVGETYFIIHPVLKHLAMFSRRAGPAARHP